MPILLVLCPLFVSGSIPSQQEMVLHTTNSLSPNHSNMLWILTTLSCAALGQMLGLSSSHAMWKKLEKLCSPTSQSRISQLRFELQTIR